MEDAEQATSSKNRTSTDRATKHHLQPRLLAALCERVLMQNAEARLLFAVEIKRILAEDPAFAEAFAEAFAAPRRGPRPATFASPLATIVQNVATLPDYVATLAENVGNVSTKVATFPQVSVANGRVAPSPQVPAPPEVPPPPHTPSPPPTSPTLLPLIPTGGTLAEPAHAGRRNESFERLCDGLYPRFKGEYARLDRDTRGLLNGTLAKLNAKMDEQDIPPELRPETISYAIRNLPNVARGTTPGNLVKHWTQAIAGADRNGRNNGLVHTRYLNETATHKHQSKLNLE